MRTERMNIGLIDVDGHNGFPNLALMRIAAYHKEAGDTVNWWNGFCHYDKVYMSKVFTFSQDVDEYTTTLPPRLAWPSASAFNLKSKGIRPPCAGGEGTKNGLLRDVRARLRVRRHSLHSASPTGGKATYPLLPSSFQNRIT